MTIWFGRIPHNEKLENSHAMKVVSSGLLVGGKSTRMGRDKCLIEVDGIPMWRRQIDLLSSLSPEVFVIAPRCPQWLPKTAIWVQDVVPDAGPIGGLAAALSKAAHQNILVLAVDMPAITSAFLKKMLPMTDQDAGIVPQIGERYEPLCAVYPRNALSVVNAQLFLQRKYSLQSLLRVLIRSGLMRSFSVPPSELCLFHNLNFPSDYTPQSHP
jgi:molybdenum cofactor guanylyltransferase